MSTILDSLKKSSDKRDDNNKTSIDNFNFANSKKSSKSGLIITMFLITITAVILYFGYHYLNDTADNAKPTPDATLSIEQTPEQDTEINEAIAIKQDNKSNTKKIQKPNNASVREKLKQGQISRQKNEKSKRNLNRVAKTKENAAKTNVKSQNKTKSIPTGSTKNDSETTSKKPEITLTMPDDSKNQKKPEPKVKKPEYTYVYQLPFSIRKEMPKFKLNIHVYDKNPENQVVVINGAKFAVGDLIDEQVLIKSIVREGVLLEFNDHVFLLPNL